MSTITLSRAANQGPWACIVAGIVATIVVGVLAEVGAKFGLTGTGLALQLAAAGALTLMYPEPPGRAWTLRTTALLVLLGIALAACWIAAVGWQANAQPPAWSRYPAHLLALGYLNAVIAAPLYEEKVVRHLLFRGLAAKTGNLASALIVSAAFGAAHGEDWLWTFIVSVVLCWIALRWNITTFQRALVHAVINLAVMTWVVNGGWG